MTSPGYVVAHFDNTLLQNVCVRHGRLKTQDLYIIWKTHYNTFVITDKSGRLDRSAWPMHWQWSTIEISCSFHELMHCSEFSLCALRKDTGELVEASMWNENRSLQTKITTMKCNTSSELFWEHLGIISERDYFSKQRKKIQSEGV